MRSASTRARCGAVPTCTLGSSSRRISAGSMSEVKSSSSASRRESGLSSPRPTAAHASIDASRSLSCNRWRSPPARTASSITACGAGEGRVRAQICRDASLVDAQSLDDRASQRHDLVGAEQRFGQDDAPIRAVVERTLQDIRRRVLPGHVGVAGKQARERADSLAQNGVLLERHHRTADLLFTERFGDLAESRAAQQTHVRRKLRERRTQTGQCGEQKIIELARIRLRADLAREQPETLEHVRFDLAGTPRMPQEPLVRRGRSDGAAQSLGRQIVEDETQIFVVDEKILRVGG